MCSFTYPKPSANEWKFYRRFCFVARSRSFSKRSIFYYSFSTATTSHSPFTLSQCAHLALSTTGFRQTKTNNFQNPFTPFLPFWKLCSSAPTQCSSNNSNPYLKRKNKIKQNKRKEKIKTSLTSKVLHRLQTVTFLRY